jgi:hypothetical protein
MGPDAPESNPGVDADSGFSVPWPAQLRLVKG